MAKLTWKALTSSTSISDPAVHGEGYQLRYRNRKGGVFAELRYKRGPGKWTAYRLGRVPSEEEARRRTIQAHIGKPLPAGGPLDWALDPIRTRARELHAQLAQGHDPRVQQSPDSLKALIDKYLRHRLPDLRPRTRTENKRHLLKYWAPLHDRPAGGLTRTEIAGRLLEIKSEHGGVAANRARATLRALFAWAFDKGLIDAMPVFPAKALDKEPSRERVLSLEELRAIWDEAGEGDYGVIVRLLALTGQRRQEVAGMRWSELDLDRGLWSLPASRTKNGRPHQVPLSTQAVALLRDLETRPGRDLVFGHADGPYSGWSRSKMNLDKRCGVKDWTLHDLRRSFMTHLIEDHDSDGLEIDPHIVDGALNHASGHARAGVIGVYNRAKHRGKIARAMQLWADHLLQSEPAKVVSLHAAG